ncbi:hypothetical protein M8J76_008920 [Diaphorina citri]|nr:hypothetical protein M8J75_006198 [Diaphorina citri]KAI5722469.1 hypothetical protein M8J76_008920 [Diaphorina citri]
MFAEVDKLRLPHECTICRKLVTASRRLLRSHASQYGVAEDDIPIDARVCVSCRASRRNRFTCCPIPSCVNHTTNRAKRLRLLPSKFHSLPPHLKSTLANEFQITPSITKCCSLCYTRVQKRLMTMGIEDPSSRPVSPSGGSTSPLLRWTEEETELLKKGLRECGTKWTAVSAIVGPSKTSHQCKSFYFNYRKTLGLDVLVQEYNKNHFGTERKPALTDEEESGSSTSSCDGLPSGVGGSGALIDSDTTSAPSPSQQGPKPSPLCPPRISESSDTTVSTHRGTPTRPPSNQAPPNREDYDSSATETADEGTTEHPSTNSPLTVKDLMLGVIEISLKNSQGGTPSSDANTKNNPPTISSILKTSESTGAGAPPPNLPPLAPPPPQSKPLSMVREAEPVTLDLSIKKPRGAEPTYPPTNKPALSLPHPVMYRAAPDTSNYYHSMMEVGRPQQAPNEVYGAPGSHLVMAVPGAAHLSVSRQPNTPSHMKPNKVRITSLSPSQHQQNRMSPSQGGGSSTSGSKLSLPPGSRTSSPRHQAPPDRYQESHHPGHTIKDMHGGHAMKESPGGSITQGTPVHSRLYPPPPPNERGAPPPPEFYGKPPSGPPNPAHRSSEPLPPARSSSNPPPLPPPPSSSSPFYPPRVPSSYASSAEQQQILMNDYLTAKQMHGGPSPVPPRRGDKATPPNQGPGGPPTGRESGGPPTSSSAAMFYQPPRQGVIQRHNTSKPPSPHFPPPPGHEAFSSLVETAVRQPSLPVPGDHKSDRERLQSLHEGLGQRFNNHDRYPPPSSREQQERFARESAAAAAAVQHQQQAAQAAAHQQAAQREREARELAAREREREAREREILAAREQQLMAARDRELQQLRDQAILREHQIRELQIREQQQKQMLRDNQLLQAQQRDRELMAMRDRDLAMAEHMAARSRLNSEQQARIHQMQMAAFQQQQQVQHHHHAAALAVAQQRMAAARSEPNSPHQAAERGGGGKTSSTSSAGSNNSDKHSAEARPQLVTAASLIDAIITHQINQPVEQGGPGPGERGHLPPAQPGLMNPSAQGTRPGDRLFQVDFNQKKLSVSPLDTSANGKISPASSLPPSLMSRGGKLCSPDAKQGPGGPPGMMSINEQIESMISRSTPNMYEQQAWKLRRALQQKEEEAHRKQSSPGAGGRYYGDPVPISPLDYVKNRIAEVMRTSEEDKGSEGREDPTPPPPRHMYSPASAHSPYMMTSSPRPPSRPVHHGGAHHDPGKPLMSDQFEPLSDDD